MRRLVCASTMLAALVTLPPVAEAVDLPFEGTLEITAPLVPLTVSGSGVAELNPATGAIRVPASVFVFSETSPFGTPLVSRFELEGRNNVGTIFAATSVFARLALAGSYRTVLNLPPATVSQVTLPISVIGGPRQLVGTFFRTTGGSAVSAALSGWASWLAGTVTATGTTGATLMVRGTDQRTAGLGGRLQLVTPIVLSIYEGGVPLGQPPGFARLTLDFVPEPATPLASSAAAVLVLLGAGRVRAARGDLDERCSYE